MTTIERFNLGRGGDKLEEYLDSIGPVFKTQMPTNIIKYSEYYLVATLKYMEQTLFQLSVTRE